MYINLVGEKFTKLTVIEPVGVNRWGNKEWICRCDCGNEIIANTRQLREKNKRDCGCTYGIRKDLRSKRFGNLTAIEPIGKKNTRYIHWKCICDCGNIVEVEGRMLTGNKKTHCGCQKKKSAAERYIGKRFGRLVVIEKTDLRNTSGNPILLCQCDCGNRTQVSTGQLISGNTKSCGCLRRERCRKNIMS